MAKYATAIDKYLNQYAEPELSSIPDLNLGSFQYCLIIPCFQESHTDLTKLWQNIDLNVLIIIVANSPVANEPVTSLLISSLIEAATKIIQQQNLYYLQIENARSILLIDRCTRPIANHEGVGRARKIGADIALSLIATGNVRCPWIFNTDADVQLPAGYFKAISNNSNLAKANTVAACIYPFSHEAAPAHKTACLLYEISLLYYVAGLAQANSTYAFNTIGSTIAIKNLSYAQVRGFPKRSAGEDFYLLNKLAKVGDIEQLDKPTLKLSGRLSMRVPFGTGTGIQKILDASHSNQEAVFYHPRSFILLKHLLTLMCESQSIEDLDRHYSMPPVDIERFNDGDAIYKWCKESNLIGLIRSKQKQQPKVFQKFIIDWMDGFRTLKFIHFIRSHYHSALPLKQLPFELLFSQFEKNSQPNANTLREFLVNQRQTIYGI